MVKPTMPLNTTTRDRRETDKICITCGKLGGACRWTDDAETCMRDQLNAMRAGFETAENEARRYAGFYPPASDGWNTFLILADRIAELANDSNTTAHDAFKDLTEALEEEHGGEHHDDGCPICVALMKLQEALENGNQ